MADRKSATVAEQHVRELVRNMDTIDPATYLTDQFIKSELCARTQFIPYWIAAGGLKRLDTWAKNAFIRQDAALANAVVSVLYQLDTLGALLALDVADRVSFRCALQMYLKSTGMGLPPDTLKCIGSLILSPPRPAPSMPQLQLPLPPGLAQLLPFPMPTPTATPCPFPIMAQSLAADRSSTPSPPPMLSTPSPTPQVKVVTTPTSPHTSPHKHTTNHDTKHTQHPPERPIRRDHSRSHNRSRSRGRSRTRSRSRSRSRSRRSTRDYRR